MINFPKLHKLFIDLEFDYLLWLGKYIQTLFTYNFGLYYTRRFWDLIIFNSIDYIILISYSIIEFNYQKLINCKTTENLVDYFKKFHDYFDKNENTTAQEFFEFLHRKLNTNKYIKILKKNK